MSSLVVNFNQLVDLAVTPSLGTINTSLLHNLLHIIINQVQLSSSFIEFHGAGSASIENYIVANQHCCGLEIDEFELKEEVDEATSRIARKRSEIKEKEIKKLFTVRNVKVDCKYPMGYPLTPIQILSTEKIENRQTNSIHDMMANVMPSDDKFINAECTEKPLKAMFDFINVSKRLDALEIGIRQLGDIFKNTQCKEDKIDGNEKEVDSMITELSDQINCLSEKMQNFKCRCSDSEFEKNLLYNFSGKASLEFNGLLLPIKTEMKNLQTAFEESQREILQFKERICERLDALKNDLVISLQEIQEMINSKMDKSFVPELKEYIQGITRSLNEKIDNTECKKPLAAGATKKIFKDLNCFSCSENVIQADARHPTQSMLTRCDEQNHPRHNNISELQLLKLPTRFCGGNHTITTPRERIFRSKSCQN